MEPKRNKVYVFFGMFVILLGVINLFGLAFKEEVFQVIPSVVEIIISAIIVLVTLIGE